MARRSQEIQIAARAVCADDREWKTAHPNGGLGAEGGEATAGADEYAVTTTRDSSWKFLSHFFWLAYRQSDDVTAVTVSVRPHDKL